VHFLRWGQWFCPYFNENTNGKLQWVEPEPEADADTDAEAEQ